MIYVCTHSSNAGSSTHTAIWYDIVCTHSLKSCYCRYLMASSKLYYINLRKCPRKSTLPPFQTHLELTPRVCRQDRCARFRVRIVCNIHIYIYMHACIYTYINMFACVCKHVLESMHFDMGIKSAAPRQSSLCAIALFTSICVYQFSVLPWSVLNAHVHVRLFLFIFFRSIFVCMHASTHARVETLSILLGRASWHGGSHKHTYAYKQTHTHTYTNS